MVGGRLLLFFVGQIFKNDHSYQPAYRCSLLACQRPKFVHRFRGEEHIRSLAVPFWPRRHSTHLLHVYYVTILPPCQGIAFIQLILFSDALVCFTIKALPLSVLCVICLLMFLKCCKSLRGGIWDCKSVLLELFVIHKPSPPGGFFGAVGFDLLLRPRVATVGVLCRA